MGWMRHHSELHGPSWQAGARIALGCFGLYLGFRYLSLNWAVSYTEYLITAFSVPLALGGFAYFIQKAAKDLLLSVAGLDLRRIDAAAEAATAAEREDRLCAAILISIDAEAKGEPGDGANWLQSYIAGDREVMAEFEAAMADFRSLGVLPSLQKREPVHAGCSSLPMIARLAARAPGG